MNEFKLIKELGLEMFKPFGEESRISVVYARDLEALLEKGVRVYGYFENGKFRTKDCTHGFGDSTHTALAIWPLPIYKDTAESLLIEALNRHEHMHANVDWSSDWDKRAQKVLNASATKKP